MAPAIRIIMTELNWRPRFHRRCAAKIASTITRDAQRQVLASENSP